MWNSNWNNSCSTGYWLDSADIAHILFTLFTLLAIQIWASPASTTLQRGNLRLRVIVWSRTVSLFPKEKPVIVGIASNYRAVHVQWIPRSFAKCFVKLDGRFHRNNDFPVSLYTLFHSAITIKIMSADKGTALWKLLTKEWQFLICVATPSFHTLLRLKGILCKIA